MKHNLHVQSGKIVLLLLVGFCLYSRVVASENNFSYEHSVTNDWNGGGNSIISFTNLSGVDMDSWTISFQTNVVINSFYDGDIVSNQDGFYIITNAYYNGSLPNGGSINTGFNWSGPPIVLENFMLYVEGEEPDIPVIEPTPMISGQNATHRRGPSEDSADSIAPGFFSTSGNQIVDSEGTPIRIAAVAWFGLESETLAPHGLWTRNYKSMMNQMLELGFNTIRLPYCNELFDPDIQPTSINYSLNPELLGKSGVELIDAIVDYASEIGLRIFLDHHRSDAGIGALGKDLWYTEDYPESRWIEDWVMLAERYQGNPTVIGADLHNEPHGPATWGDGNLATDWRLAAERAAVAIHAVEPEWLIIVEGIATYNDNPYWWGGNLQGVAEHPVRIDQPNKLVYSPHAYPPSIFDQPWFSHPEYPDNLAAVWDEMWGYIYFEEIAPILLGEWGSRFENPDDLLWLDKMSLYLDGNRTAQGSTTSLPEGHQGMSWSWWSWNPNSGDTGGILDDSWQTPIPEKLAYLQPLQFSFGTAQNIPIAESNWVDLQITVSDLGENELIVEWHTNENTAREEIDFVASSGSLVFTPDSTEKTISVEILAGDQDSPDPAEFHVIVNTANEAAILATPSLTITILGYDPTSYDDDNGEDTPPLDTESWTTWQDQNFTSQELLDPTISGPQAELLNDGWPNLLRYATGLSATEPVPAEAKPVLMRDATSLLFRYQELHEEMISIEASSNLIEWTEVNWPIHQRTVKDSGITEIILDVPESTSTDPVFIRLTVTQ